MNGMQQTILAMCNDIANVNNWNLTVSFDVDTLRVDFTCNDPEQKNCYASVGTNCKENLIRTLFKNLLALRFGEIVEALDGDLTKEWFIITKVDFEDKTN